MSLTVCVQNSRRVSIVRWFLDLKGLVLFASGPVIHMSWPKFRDEGWNFVRHHFDNDYPKIRLSREKIVKPFGPGEAKSVMKNARVLEIHTDPDRKWILSPMIVERYSLGDLKRVKPLVERIIPGGSPPDVFWEAFDEALADAPPG